jgi:hypothetical protein
MRWDPTCNTLYEYIVSSIASAIDNIAKMCYNPFNKFEVTYPG